MKERIQRVGLLTAMSLATLNIWTGAPLLGLWVGSRVQGSGPPTMEAVGTVAVVMAAVCFVLVRVMAILNSVYDRVTGHASRSRRHVPWLRSMRGERPHEHSTDRAVSPIDVILVASVVIVVALFEIWFFFYSGSPIGGGGSSSGRD